MYDDDGLCTVLILACARNIPPGGLRGYQQCSAQLSTLCTKAFLSMF